MIPIPADIDIDQPDRYDETIRQKLIHGITYFLGEKGDLERWSEYEKYRLLIEKHYPEVIKAWNDYKVAEKILSAVITNL